MHILVNILIKITFSNFKLLLINISLWLIICRIYKSFLFNIEGLNIKNGLINEIN